MKHKPGAFSAALPKFLLIYRTLIIQEKLTITTDHRHPIKPMKAIVYKRYGTPDVLHI